MTEIVRSLESTKEWNERIIRHGEKHKNRRGLSVLLRPTVQPPSRIDGLPNYFRATQTSGRKFALLMKASVVAKASAGGGSVD